MFHAALLFEVKEEDLALSLADAAKVAQQEGRLMALHFGADDLAEWTRMVDGLGKFFIKKKLKEKV
jgi:hypothetical protein